MAKQISVLNGPNLNLLGTREPEVYGSQTLADIERELKVAAQEKSAAVSLRFIEVHLSNLHKREELRHRSYLADLEVGTIAGLGASGYRYALDFALNAAPQS